ELDITVVLGASVHRVEQQDGTVSAATFATRHGDVCVTAAGFVDATGDAALTWEAGLPCRVPERTVWGSQQIRLANLNEQQAPTREELVARVEEKAEQYGLVRRDGLAFFFPGR